MPDSFDTFWAAWPNNTVTYPRKGCKTECKRRWMARKLDLEAEQIINHVRWLKTTDDWIKESGRYIPAPLVYLNQSRWDGAEIPAPVEVSESERKMVYEAQLNASIRRFVGETNVRRVA